MVSHANFANGYNILPPEIARYEFLSIKIIVRCMNMSQIISNT